MRTLQVIPMILTLFLIFIIMHLHHKYQYILINFGESEQKGVFINAEYYGPGTYLLFANPRTDLNSTPRLFKHIASEKDNKFWIRGIHKLSLDSRYFGYLDKQKVFRYYKPIYTWR